MDQKDLGLPNRCVTVESLLIKATKEKEKKNLQELSTLDTIRLEESNNE